MIKVAVASMFRDSVTFHGHRIDQVERFFRQLGDQQGLGHRFDLSLHLVEGDSKDNTRQELEYHLARWPHGPTELLHHSVNAFPVASLEDPVRFRQLSAVANVAFRAARDSGADYVLWVESDLIVGPMMITSLLEAFGPKNEFAAIVAVGPLPFFMSNGQKLFYDTWSMRGHGGQRWSNGDYHRFKEGSLRYRRLASVGCCALIDAGVLRAGNIDFGEGCFPALCESIRAAGKEVVCDMETEIEHPSSMLVASRLV